jgi:hypothetical protein
MDHPERYSSSAGTANSNARQAMAKDVSVVVDDPPGEPARQAEATGGAGVDTEAARGGTTGGEHAAVHILVDDVAATPSAPANAGLEARHKRGAIGPDVEHRPGTRARVARECRRRRSDPAFTTCGAARLVFRRRDFERGARGGLSQARGFRMPA